MLRSFPLLMVAMTVLVCPGCGDKLARVEGTVTFNGVPVERGMISLDPADGKGTVSGANIQQGKFEIQDVYPGEKIVSLSAVYSKGIQKDADGAEIELFDDLLPAEYGPGSKQRLTVELPVTKKDYVITGPDPRSKKK
jgi:hypothetical protein